VSRLKPPGLFYPAKTRTYEKEIFSADKEKSVFVFIHSIPGWGKASKPSGGRISRGKKDGRPIMDFDTQVQVTKPQPILLIPGVEINPTKFFSNGRRKMNPSFSYFLNA
jgi:hypothetical protein